MVEKILYLYRITNKTDNNLYIIIMKRAGIITGLLLALLIAGSGCRHERSEKGNMREYPRMAHMRMDRDFWYTRHMHNIRGHMTPEEDNGMMRGMWQMDHGIRMMPGMGRMPMDSMGVMPFGAGRRMLGSIPNVTESQKKQIKDLAIKNQEEMRKLREEMSSKMKDLMDSHRKDVLNILTEEQKKFIGGQS
jgi:hypothetical protein